MHTYNLRSRVRSRSPEFAVGGNQGFSFFDEKKVKNSKTKRNLKGVVDLLSPGGSIEKDNLGSEKLPITLDGRESVVLTPGKKTRGGKNKAPENNRNESVDSETQTGGLENTDTDGKPSMLKAACDKAKDLASKARAKAVSIGGGVAKLAREHPYIATAIVATVVIAATAAITIYLSGGFAAKASLAAATGKGMSQSLDSRATCTSGKCLPTSDVSPSTAQAQPVVSATAVPTKLDTPATPVKSTAAGASKLPPPPVKPVCLKDPSYGCANVREFDEYYKQMAEYNKIYKKTLK